MQIKKTIKAIVFDMDGVIVDSEYHWAMIEHELLKKIAQNWNREKQNKITGMGVDDLYSFLKNENGLSMGKKEFDRVYDEIAFDIYKNTTTKQIAKVYSPG